MFPVSCMQELAAQGADRYPLPDEDGSSAAESEDNDEGDEAWPADAAPDLGMQELTEAHLEDVATSSEIPDLPEEWPQLAERLAADDAAIVLEDSPEKVAPVSAMKSHTSSGNDPALQHPMLSKLKGRDVLLEKLLNCAEKKFRQVDPNSRLGLSHVGMRDIAL